MYLCLIYRKLSGEIARVENGVVVLLNFLMYVQNILQVK